MGAELLISSLVLWWTIDQSEKDSIGLPALFIASLIYIASIVSASVLLAGVQRKFVSMVRQYVYVGSVSTLVALIVEGYLVITMKPSGLKFYIVRAVLTIALRAYVSLCIWSLSAKIERGEPIRKR